MTDWRQEPGVMVYVLWWQIPGTWWQINCGGNVSTSANNSLLKKITKSNAYILESINGLDVRSANVRQANIRCVNMIFKKEKKILGIKNLASKETTSCITLKKNLKLIQNMERVGTWSMTLLHSGEKHWAGAWLWAQLQHPSANNLSKTKVLIHKVGAKAASTSQGCY